MQAIHLNHYARTLVDDDEYHHLMAIGKWCLSTVGYAIHYQTIDDRRRNILMHRMIMDAPPHLQVDHINHDKLDNRRENLHFATRSQNQANKTIQKNNTSTYKGGGISDSKDAVAGQSS